jgi:uncharacterized membrane protein
VALMRLRIGALSEHVRASLFFVPMIGVVIAVVLGFIGISADSRLHDGSIELPFGLTSTVDSARALLSTIAGATITFAGIAFSVSLLIIQQASSQYSPRVVHTLFRDPFNKRVMGLVVGTFTYCVMILRSTRSALEESGDPVIPNLSVAVAVVLGIATILAIVAFIDHSAHSMDISEILENVRRDTNAQIRAEWTEAGPGGDPRADDDGDLSRPHSVIRFDETGWVQQLDVEALLACTPDHSVLRIETHPGRYAIKGAPLCTITPPAADVEDLQVRLRAAVSTGDTRTMQQDASYGLRQLADVALKALSPGINDPTTAQDAIFHAAAVLAELLRHDPPPKVLEATEGKRLVLSQQFTHEELVSLAFDETRRAAAGLPTVCIYLLEALELLVDTVRAAGLTDRTAALEAQARLVLEGCEAADLLPADLDSVRHAYRKRFVASAPAGDALRHEVGGQV